MEAARFDLAQVVEDQDLQRQLVAGERLSVRQEEVIGERGDGGQRAGEGTESMS